MHELVPGAALDGQILLDGEDIYGPGMRAQQVRMRVGMVFQKPNPFPAMSIRENVLSGLKLARIRCDDRTRWSSSRSSGPACGRRCATGSTRPAARSRAASSSGSASPGRWPCSPTCC